MGRVERKDVKKNWDMEWKRKYEDPPPPPTHKAKNQYNSFVYTLIYRWLLCCCFVSVGQDSVLWTEIHRISLITRFSNKNKFTWEINHLLNRSSLTFWLWRNQSKNELNEWTLLCHVGWWMGLYTTGTQIEQLPSWIIIVYPNDFIFRCRGMNGWMESSSPLCWLLLRLLGNFKMVFCLFLFIQMNLIDAISDLC